MGIQEFLTKQEYIASANSMKEGKSVDFGEGFDTGANWLADYTMELIKCQTSQSENLEEE